MKTRLFFTLHISRPCSTRKGSESSELVQQLRKIYNHSQAFPLPKKPEYIEIDLSKLIGEKPENPKLEKTAAYKKLVADTQREIDEKYVQGMWKNAYDLKNSYSANGGTFSYAQNIANKSGNNVIGIKGEISSPTPTKVLFKPQGKLQSILSNLGNFILSKFS
ncbi:hypothetical protein ABRP32_01050 [Providencia manganoxydans]|uniref:hypothetical protein n=1 Tax=Providencia manganoxydans TaxID=2923283 RepID=UPI003AF39E31